MAIKILGGQLGNSEYELYIRYYCSNVKFLDSDNGILVI